MSGEDFADEIRRLAMLRYAREGLSKMGQMQPAEVKALEAREAELIAQLDELRGTADATYLEFREAFERGADCAALFEVRNRMHPKDPLKVAANEDLRSVGCRSPRATRQELSDGPR